MLGEMRSYAIGVMKLIVRIIRGEEYDVGEPELLDTYINYIECNHLFKWISDHEG
ncbi:hypothetical protein NC652_038980 [Populus alba x Populus x berolinensis]|nr:hypothetical protein NC652_038980 [Populus alba x Populus x berolinensis]